MDLLSEHLLSGFRYLTATA